MAQRKVTVTLGEMEARELIAVAYERAEKMRYRTLAAGTSDVADRAIAEAILCQSAVEALLAALHGTDDPGDHFAYPVRS